MIRAAFLFVFALALTGCSGDSPQAARRPFPALAPSLTTPATAERPLLEIEPPRADRIDLARRLGGMPNAAPWTPPAGQEQQGDRRDFWVIQSDPPRAFQVAATVRAVTEHAYLYVQDDASVGDDDMAKAARDFEETVYPSVTRLFGEPVPAAGGDPRITILHLNLPGVGGYFTGVDQLPRSVARTSNERRMLYIDLRAGPPGSPAYPGLVAHEFQHLIHHDVNPTADTWLNEGLSEVADEAAGGAGSFLRAYTNNPGTALTDWAVSGSNAAHYGAAHSFLRYLLRHYGGLEHARDLLAQGGSGVNAVQKYLRGGSFGAGFEDVFADWLAAGYAGAPGDGRFSNPGAATGVRNVIRLADQQDGNGTVNQFGADYYDIAPRGKDMVFRFQGVTTVRQAPNRPASGQGEWWSGRGDSIDATLTRGLDLRSVTAATLRFKLWHDIESGYDYGYVAVSMDGGATWTPLRGRHTSDFDPLGQAYGPGYTGASGGRGTPAWVDEQIDLTPYAGRAVLVRFEYVTDEAANGAGMTIDDISVPEIGFTDDAEQDAGWQAAGFRRVTGPLPARYLIQLVTEEAGGWTSRPIAVSADGTAEVRIRAGDRRAAIIVAGVTYSTNQPAAYRWQFGPAGG